MLHLVCVEKLVMMPHMGASFLRDTQNVKFSKAITKIIIPNTQHCANLLSCCNYQVLTLHFTSEPYKNKHYINLQHTDTVCYLTGMCHFHVTLTVL